VFDKVARQRVSVLLDNAPRDEAALPESVRLSQTHSVMAAPIVGRRGLLGLIYVDLQDRRHTFSPDDLDLLNAAAVQAGIAIDTAHAHESLQREAKAREKYERFLPQQLVDDVMLDPDREVAPGGTRQAVTVLFADLRGFTTLAEETTPEAVVELLNRFFSLMSEVIFRHGGTLDKYIGDGVMALFGAPYPTERDAVKAVRAAVDMQRAVQAWNRERLAAGQAEVGVGIGINSGPAIVGFIGSSTRLDYTAIGDTVNMASRLEHLATAGQIIVSEHTMQALDAGVAYTVLDAVQVKGRAAKLQIGEVTWRRGA
jgi:adenylate cyclase